MAAVKFPTPTPEPTAEDAIQQLYLKLQTRLKLLQDAIDKQNKACPRPGNFGAFDDEDDAKYRRECEAWQNVINHLDGQKKATLEFWDDVKKVYGENRALVAVENLQQRIGSIPYAE